MNDALNVYAAQLNPTVGDVAGNAAKIYDAWQKARAAKADLLITPELSVLGYTPEDLVKKPDLLAECADAYGWLAAATADGPPLLVGGPVVENGKVFNAALYLRHGWVEQIIKKHDLPNYGVFDDKRLFAAGDEAGMIEVGGVSMGVLICEDAWFPDVAAALRAKGARALLSMNGSPYEAGKENASRMRVLQDRVRETGLPLLYVNQVGGQDGVVYDGHSLALDSAGDITWRAPGWAEHAACVRFDSGAFRGPLAPWGEGLEQLYSALVLGTRDYIRKNGFKRVVLGLSGGADSALVAVIAADAIGAENVHCVRLPSVYTSNDSMVDADILAANLGCPIATLPIAAMVQAAADSLTQYFDAPPSDLTEQNLQARLRGLSLMAITNQNPDMLLLTTGNKSEMSVGYATLYGDMSGGFNPLKDVYKTSVFALMEWRNRARPTGALGPSGTVIPQAIIDKKPSAELKPGQTDESELGSYAALDAVLQELIERETPIAAIVAAGHDAAYVAKISRLLDRAEYKRRQAAPGVKVTSRALFGDRRYPVTNGFITAARLGDAFAARMQARIAAPHP
jgi:NAD+ synthase